MEADSAELVPKKKKVKGTPSAILRRAPDAELPPVPEVPQEAAPVSVEQRPGMDEQLEVHLLSMDHPGHSGPAKPDHVQFNGTPVPGVEKFLDWTQRIHSPVQIVTGDSGHSSSEMAQADLDTSSCG